MPSRIAILDSFTKLSARWSDAENAYKEALRIEPYDAPTYFSLGRCFTNDGKDAEAVTAYKQAIKLKPNFAKAHNELALLYPAADETEAAWAEYDELLRVNEALAQNLYARLNQN